MRFHQLRKICEHISTLVMKLSTYCKLLSQEQTELGSHEVLSLCIDECYQEVTSFLNIALPQDLDDLLDLGVSMKCDSSTNGSCFQGRERDQ